MQQIINQYSIVWIAFAVLAVAALIFFRQKPGFSDLVAFAVVLLGLYVAWNTLRPRQTPLMEDAQAVQDMIGAGTPVLLEFQSPY
jgi:hypothetical protein